MSERRAALVTGSTSGIGLGIARALAMAGMDVTLNGMGDPEEIERIRSGLEREADVVVRYDGSNLFHGKACEGLVEAVISAFGRIDVLVNNAGIQHVSPVEDFPTEKWDAILALNLSAAFHTIRAAMRPMKQAGFGRIINIASAHAHVASPFKAAYVAAKHGLLGLTKTVALEGATFNVRCNAISPGYVLTPLVENQIPDTMRSRGMTRDQVVNEVLLAAQPTKQFVRIEDVASLAVFLTTPAADQINGASLSVDGGWTSQ